MSETTTEVEVPEELKDWEPLSLKKEYSTELKNYRNLLLADLSIRVKNGHLGSYFGGNPSQLAYLLTHKVVFDAVRSGPEVALTFDGTVLTFWFSTDFLKKSLDLRVVRKALDEYWASLPESEEVSFTQLVDVEWWTNRIFTPEAFALVALLRRVDDFISELDEKQDILDAFNEMVGKEEDELKKKFWAEMGVSNHESLKESDAIDEDQFELIDEFMKTHPLYKREMAKISKRVDKVIRSLFSEKNLLFLKTINVAPEFLRTTVMRKVGINKIVSLYLNNYLNGPDNESSHNKYKNPTESEKLEE